MKFLSPSTALLVGGLAVPALLLLYFLKLRRQERAISSTLLWKRAIQDLQVNAPFQKLRKNFLLFLQLLILAAILFGLADPVANFVKKPQRNVVVLIDRSASMKTIEADGRTRLDHAKDGAIEWVGNLPGESRAMVIAFSSRAEVVCTFTDDHRRLTRRIEAVKSGDGPTKIGEALQLAAAYSTQIATGGEGWAPDSVETADIELFSDGRVADTDKASITRGKMTYYRVGEAADNVGIVAFDMRRDLEQPGVVTVFARVQNFGPRPVTTDVSVSLDKHLLDVKGVSLGPAASSTTRPTNPASSNTRASAPSSRNLLFKLDREAGGILEIKIHREDTLASDNVVRAAIDPPRPIRVLAVTDRPLIREDMVRAFGIHDLTLLTPSEYESADENTLAIEGRSAFDLVVIDKHDTDRLWPGNYLFFGGIPLIDGVASGDDVMEHIFVSWRENHPLLRHVTLENVYVWKWKRLTLPSRAVKLIEGQDSTAMAMLTDPGHRYVITAFDLLDTNFRRKFAFPIFLQNVVLYLATGGLSDAEHLISPGSTITIPVPPGAQTVRITRPDGSNADLDVRNRMTATYAQTDQCGLYQALFDDPSKTKLIYTANLLDPNESLTAPNPRFTIGTETVAAIAGEIKSNEPLWPYAAAVALLVLLLEWWVYNKRVMI